MNQDIILTGNNVIFLAKQENIFRQYIPENIKIELTHDHINSDMYNSVNSGSNVLKMVDVSFNGDLSLHTMCKSIIIDKILLLVAQGYTDFKVVIDKYTIINHNTTISFDILYKNN